MGFLPIVVGIEDSTGARADAKRADGNRAPILIRFDGLFTTGYEFDGGNTRVIIGSAIAALDGAGILTIGASATSIVIGGSGIAVSVPGDFSAGGDVTVTGNLTVDGTTTSIKSTVLDVADRVIHVNDSEGADDPVPTDIAGIAVHRGAIAGVDRDHAGWIWDEANSMWRAAWNTAGDDTTIGADLAVRTGTLSVTTGADVAPAGLVRLPDVGSITAWGTGASTIDMLTKDAADTVYVGGAQVGARPNALDYSSATGHWFRTNTSSKMIISAADIDIRVPLKWGNTVVGPTFYQETHPTTPQAMVFHAMDVTLGTGSDFRLRPGAGSVAHGLFSFRDGGDTPRITIDGAGEVELNSSLFFTDGAPVIAPRDATAIPGYSPLTTSLSLDGVAFGGEWINYGNVTEMAPERTDPFTVAIWVKTTACNSNDTAFCKYGGSKGWKIIASDSVGSWRFVGPRASTKDLYVTASQPGGAPSIRDGNWHLLTATSGGNSTLTEADIRIYIDGVEITGAARTHNGGSVTNTTVGTHVLAVGNENGQGGEWPGNVLHAAGWGFEMTPAQVAELYGGGSPQDLDNMSFAKPVFWDTMGDGDSLGAGNMIDLSINANHGTAEAAVDAGDFVSDVPVAALLLHGLDVSTGAGGNVAIRPGSGPVPGASLFLRDRLNVDRVTVDPDGTLLLHANFGILTTADQARAPVQTDAFDGVQTVDSTITTAVTHDSDTGDSLFFTAEVSWRSETDGDSGSTIIHGSAENTGGVLSIGGANSVPHVWEEDAGWGSVQGSAVIVDTSGAGLRVRVEGQGADIINWSVKLHVVTHQAT